MASKTYYRVEYKDGFGKKSRILDLKKGGELLDLKTAKHHAEHKVMDGAIEATIFEVDGDKERVVMICIRNNQGVLWKDIRK